MKTETKHTQEPWMSQYRQQTISIVGGLDGLGGGHLIATINHSCREDNNPNAIRDALLIKAAPELLEGLKELSEWMRAHTGPADGTHDMLVRAHHTIAKAEGRDETR